MKTALLVLLSMLMLACAGNQNLDEGPRVIDVSTGDDPVEFAVGVHNADNQNGEAEFSVSLVWPDGTQTLVFDRAYLGDWVGAIDGAHHPNVNVTVVVRAATPPVQVRLQDHLRQREKVVEIDPTRRHQTLGFFLAPEDIGTIQRIGDAPAGNNPWAPES